MKPKPKNETVKSHERTVRPSKSNDWTITERLFLTIRQGVTKSSLFALHPQHSKEPTIDSCSVCFETRNVEVMTGTTNYSTPLQDRHCSLIWECWFVVVSRDTVVVVVLVWMLILNKLTRNRHGCWNKIHSTTLNVTLNNTWQHVGFADR